MNFKPVVVGVDPTPESAAAVHLGWQIARAAKTQCHLVHAVGQTQTIPIVAASPAEQERLTQKVADLARQKLVDALSGHVPAEAFRQLEIVMGNPTWAIGEAAHRHRAYLVVLGGKHHAAVARWFGGSTAHHAVRTLDVPMIVNWSPRAAERRVLAAVDLSYAAAAVIAEARRISSLFESQLRVLHAIEPVPFFGELALPVDELVFQQTAETRFRKLIADMFGDTPDFEVTTRRGSADGAIRAEAGEWDPDLVVVGTHGTNWVHRVLVGSTTERLLNRLPTSLLIVPVAPKTGRHSAGNETATGRQPAGAQ